MLGDKKAGPFKPEVEWIKVERAGGYSGRLGHDHLVHGRRLAALPLGGRGAGAVFHLGVAGDRAATEHHGDELVV